MNKDYIYTPIIFNTKKMISPTYTQDQLISAPYINSLNGGNNIVNLSDLEIKPLEKHDSIYSSVEDKIELEESIDLSNKNADTNITKTRDSIDTTNGLSESTKNDTVIEVIEIKKEKSKNISIKCNKTIIIKLFAISSAIFVGMIVLGILIGCILVPVIVSKQK